MNLQAQDCYTILPSDEIGSNPLKWVVITSDNKTVVLEKRSGVIILTEDELKKITRDAFDAGGEYESAQFYNQYGGNKTCLSKTEYINNLIKP